MKFFLLFLFLVVSLFSYNETKAQKALSEVDRAEVYGERLVTNGEFKEANLFLLKAMKRYKNSFSLLYWSGVSQEIDKKGDLELAEKYFRQALALQQNNKTVRQHIENIQKLKKAKKNENVIDLLDYLQDKGTDFLMIFLAFLGSEIIAKRYSICKNNSISFMIQKYKNRREIAISWKNKTFFTLKQMLSKQFSFQCLFINFLILITLATSMLIPLLFIEFQWEITIFLNESILLMDTQVIETHIWQMFLLFFIISFIGVQVIKILNLPKKVYIYEITFISELDALIERGSYVDIVEIANQLNTQEDREEVEKLIEKYSIDSEKIYKYFRL